MLFRYGDVLPIEYTMEDEEFQFIKVTEISECLDHIYYAIRCCDRRVTEELPQDFK